MIKKRHKLGWAHLLSSRRSNEGQAMLMTVITFLFVSLAVVVGISDPVLRHRAFQRDMQNSRESYYLAESGLEDAFYRLQNDKQTFGSMQVNINGAVAETSLVDVPGGGKDINVTGNNKGAVRKISIPLKAGVGGSFNYGVQSGAGGFVLGNNVTINGSVYANGSIVGSNGAVITGSAVSANSSAIFSDQSNSSPEVPPYSITFGNSSGGQDLAQSFQLSSTSPVTKISLYIKKIGSPSNLTLRIVTDSGGSPSNNTIVSGTLNSSLVTSNYSWVDVSLSEYANLNPSTTYWLVLDGGTSGSKYYILGANNFYQNGQAKIGQYSDSWGSTNPSGLDVYFKIYLGGLNGLIDGVQIGSGGVGNAEAYQVKNSTVAGSLFCQIGSGNNKPCDTSKSPPVAQGLPISDGNIALWKNEAVSGGVINGNYTVSSSIALGPKKIVGNLKINGGKILTMTGTIWVTGNVELEGGAKLKLDSSYGSNSGVFVTDGVAKIENNSQFLGSGQSGSNILFLTTSDCPLSAYCDGNPAIEIENNTGAIILNAQNGTVDINNNASVKEVTAYKTIFNNGSSVTYESGLTNINFTNGPTGGWSISNWQEVE